jgi:hypothetical protein
MKPAGYSKAEALRWATLCIWSALVCYMLLGFNPTTSGTAGWVISLCLRWRLPTQTPAIAFHFAAFAVWSFLLCGALASGYLRPLSRGRWFAALGVLAALAVITEVLQGLTPNRVVDPLDAGLNILGTLTGMGFRGLLHRWVPAPLADAPASPGAASQADPSS